MVSTCWKRLKKKSLSLFLAPGLDRWDPICEAYNEKKKKIILYDWRDITNYL